MRKIFSPECPANVVISARRISIVYILKREREHCQRN
jgi:hypothetical protein